MFKIMGRYGYGRAEEIDSAETRKEAEAMLREYRIAFGAGWQLWIVKE